MVKCKVSKSSKGLKVGRGWNPYVLDYCIGFERIRQCYVLNCMHYMHCFLTRKRLICWTQQNRNQVKWLTKCLIMPPLWIRVVGVSTAVSRKLDVKCVHLLLQWCGFTSHIHIGMFLSGQRVWVANHSFFELRCHYS